MSRDVFLECKNGNERQRRMIVYALRLVRKMFIVIPFSVPPLLFVNQGAIYNSLTYQFLFDEIMGK